MTQKSKEGRNVPNLRFPGFKEEWNERKLGSLLTIGSGKDYKHLSSGNIPVYGTGGYMTSVDKYLYNGISIGIGRKGTIDKPILFSGKFWTVDTLFYTHSFKNSEPKFLYSVFQKINWKKYNEASGVPSLSKTTIEKIKVEIPSLQEQKKIASFLEIIDLRIDTQSKIIRELQSLKISLQRKIFTQELKLSESHKQWHTVKLRDLGSFFSGGTPLTTKKQYYDGDIPFIKSGEINSNNTEQFISEEGLKNSSAKLIESGDLIYALYGATSGEVGISKIDGAINQAVLCIRTNMDNIFLFNFLVFNKERILKTYLQGGQGNLSAEIIKSLEVPYPHIQEQQKIASIFSAIDDKIVLETELLGQFMSQKQYFLQNLFI